jgi:hypothetical protein
MSQPAHLSTTHSNPNPQGQLFQEVPAPEGTQVAQSAEEKAEEAHRILRLQLMLHRVMLVIQEDRKLPVERASALVANARRAALAMFPDKAQAFDLLWWPRLQRTMRERYRMQ